MNKNEYLHKLQHLLKKVPAGARKEMLNDYEEYFELGMKNGISEKKLIQELGDPYVIARALLVNNRKKHIEKDQTFSNIFKAVIATVSLSFFNVVFILGPVVGLIGVYVGLCAVAIALTLSPLAIIASIYFNGAFPSIAVNFFVAITLCSLGLLMSIGMMYVGKFLYNAVRSYIKLNINIVKGGQAA
ncbi:HAAS signaling domain-containing protein [Jeotgalibacillus marinus]|uniref:DUF1700 domain-containing protein n=1 Tax=Jeotgalibacillus marinus TaxID=86667 RepID=A0ABV3Q6X4_9BACL